MKVHSHRRFLVFLVLVFECVLVTDARKEALLAKCKAGFLCKSLLSGQVRVFHHKEWWDLLGEN